MQRRLEFTVMLDGAEDVRLETRVLRLRIDNLSLEFECQEAYEHFRESMAEALGLIHPDELTSPEQYARWRSLRATRKAAVAAAAM